MHPDYSLTADTDVTQTILFPSLPISCHSVCISCKKDSLYKYIIHSFAYLSNVPDFARIFFIEWQKGHTA